ncbi:MAG: alpha-glucan family phosphorylase [Syntrophorhabdales bacterium]|jgi:starch phosphorylase
MMESNFSSELRKFAGFEELIEIALDLRWSWNHGADDIWRPLDPELWDLTRNPWVILETSAPDKLERLSKDRDFRSRVESIAEEVRQSRTVDGWFQKAHRDAPFRTIAYFSMEFMLGEALPIYSGGLGNVAGDHLKAASDLGIPLVGVGLLYQQGYFRQAIAPDGSQSAVYPYNDPGQLQVTPARDASGEWVRIPLGLPTFKVWIRAWEVRVGRTKLYLLDTNDPANPPVVRGITSQLYGGGPEVRLAQEIVLGIAGWRLLRALGIDPEVCHLNEGHSAFMVLERALDYMKITGHPFDVALHVTRSGNLFTTHTPVAAGFDRFPPDIMEQYLGVYARERLGISFHDLLALGRQNPDDENEPFNMTYLAIHGSGAINGVSRLHGDVSRAIFQPLFPRWPRDEVPIGHVTNGIHVPTWDSSHSDALWTKHCGEGRWLDEGHAMAEAIRRVTDEELWAMRRTSRAILVEYARARYARQLAFSTVPLDKTTQAQQILDPEVLTLGFARRFTAYKRPTLLLHDPDRLIRILTNPERPVQLILAGKAHPADLEGQDMIRQWIEFIRRPEVGGHAVFLSDYDMLLTEQLVGGVDVWINTPRRPWEACGTSGMKVLVNGGLNLSELDGWWAEAYTPQVGWAIGDGQEHDGDSAWDAAEAGELYALLENEVVPQFYNRDAGGIPAEWLSKMRESMAGLTLSFSADRAVREYTDEYYVPAAARFAARRANEGALGVALASLQRALEQNWHSLSFSGLRVETCDGYHYFRVTVDFGALDPADVLVELYARKPATGGAAFGQPFRRGDKVPGSKNSYICFTQVEATRPPGDFTPRIIPQSKDFAVPLEMSHIMWER